MRDILVVLIYASVLIYAGWKRSPFLALILYFWISFMNPHRYTWGFAYSLPLAMGAALFTAVLLFFRLNDITFPKVREIYFFLALWFFLTITSFFAMYPEYVWARWEVVNKILFMTFITMLLVNTKDRLLIFLFSVTFFIGFIAIKGAIFGIVTRGQYMLWGPDESFLADNNSVGLALVMILPFAYAVKDIFENKWITASSYTLSFFIVISVIITYSRGALVGLAMVVGHIILRSKHKYMIAAIALVVIVTGYQFLPGPWLERMKTIKSFQDDRSAQMRINAWLTAFNAAKARPLGAGFDCWTLEYYDLYSPNPELGRRIAGGGTTAHSIYFEVLATQGFGGFFLFMACLILMFISLNTIKRRCARLPVPQWITALNNAFIGSMIGFMSAGAFLSLAFFDLFWAIYACAVSFKVMLHSQSFLGSEMSNNLALN